MPAQTSHFSGAIRKTPPRLTRRERAARLSNVTTFECVEPRPFSNDLMNQPFHSSALPSTLADRAFILVGHDPNTIKKHCDNAVVLSDGRLYAFPDVDSAYSFYLETFTKKPESIEQWLM
jgi:hypothetical protein